MLNKAPSEPGLGCANTHIWAAGCSGAAELLPHSWRAAPDLLDKRSFGPVGAPGELGALEGTVPTRPSAGSSPLWLPPVIFIRPGTLRLTAFPAEGMPSSSVSGQHPARTGERRTKAAGREGASCGQRSIRAAIPVQQLPHHAPSRNS